MNRAAPTEPRSRRRKWRRRGVLAVLLAVVLVLALPFLFPGAAVRYWLRHSALRDVPVRFRAARLWPTGRVTLYGLEIDRPAAPGHSLLTAETAEVDFHWTDLAAMRLETLVLGQLELTLPRGVDAAAALHGLEARGLACDQIIATGNVRLEGREPWMELIPLGPGEAVPLQLVVKAAPGSAAAGADVSLILGAAESEDRPFLTARFTVQRAADATTVKIDGLNLGCLAPAFTEALWQAWPGMPGPLRATGSGRLERLIVSGSASFGRDITLNLTGEARDLNLRLNLGGMSAATEHFSVAAHLEGNVTAPRLKGLHLARAHCAWEALGAADWTLRRGAADFEVDGSEIVLSDMKSEFQEAQVEAMGAYDTLAGILSRGRIWIRDLRAPTLRARLPQSVRRALPDAFEGLLAARLFLAESDSEHLSAYVECECPDDLTFNAPPAAGTAPAAPTAADGRAALPRAVLSAGLLSGTVVWNFRNAPTLEVTHGRFTADGLLAVPPASPALTQGTALERIKSDFGISGGLFRLEDFYADLPGNGRLSAEGTYVLADGALEDVVVNFSGADLALADPWLPPGWTLTGQADADCRGSLSARAGSLALSLGLGAPAALSGPACRLSITGTPAVAALQAAFDRPAGALRVSSGEVAGLGGIQADDGFVGLLRRAAAPAPDSTAAFFFDRAAAGAFASLDKISFSGRLAPAEAAATVSFSGMDLGAGAASGNAGAERDRPGVLNLSLKADLSLALRDGIPDPATLAVKDGQFLAERVLVGQNVFTGVAGNLTVQNGRVFITSGALSTAEGTIDGDALLTAAGRLEMLHLGFDDLAQQSLFRRLYPDLFSAEGPVSGTLTLARGEGQADLAGAIEITADRPGRLMLSPQAAHTLLGNAAAPAAIGQLADYRYAAGKTTLKDESADGRTWLQIALDYPPAAGGAGTYQLKAAVRVESSVAEILAQFLGLRPPAAAVTRPAP